MFSAGMLMPGAVYHTPNSCSGCGYGSGFSSTPSMTLKIAALAPIPSARVITAMALNTGARPRRRSTWRYRI